MRCLAQSIIVVAFGALFAACGGGSSGGNFVPPPTTGFQPLGATQEIRPDLLSGASVPPVSLNDQLTHVYRFPGIPGVTYRIEIATQPPNQQLRVEVTEVVNGGAILLGQNATTPFTAQVQAVNDVQLDVRVFDFNQGGLTLSSLRVTPTGFSFDQGRFRVFLHICGDSFAGLGMFNDLATTNDQAAFASALLNGVNSTFPAGTQVDVGTSGFAQRTNAEVLSVAPSLVVNGRTVLPNTTAEEDALGQLGVPESDPNWGLAADVFILHSANPAFPDGTGQCDCVPAGQGGVFRGRGPDHSVFVRLFNAQGQPRTLGELTNTLTHELGHFLSLRHPTESSFWPDDLTDTPFSTAAQDANGNGMLDPNEGTGPDATNVMFLYAGNKTVWTAQQQAAMRAYLGLREHQ